EVGIVHRDLKPSNVFLAQEAGEEVVKLFDFGVAKMETAPIEERTATGMLLGSPHFMSPEQVLGEGVDLRSDLWSLAVLLFVMLTGGRPLAGPPPPQILAATPREGPPRAPQPPPPPPAAIDEFFARAFSRDPAGRFASAREFFEAFAEIARSGATHSAPAVT